MNNKMNIVRAQARTLLEWFLFQEQNDIRIENSSLHIQEIKLANKLTKSVSKLKKFRKGSYIVIGVEEATIAFGWFESLPQPLLDKSDLRMHNLLKTFCVKNKE